MNKKKKQNGFTIVELVIVIAVIGILAAVLIPTFSNLVKKAKESADQQLVYHINVAAAANEVDNGKAPTMYDTLQALENDYGFTIEKMTPRSGCDIVWDSTTNRFALVENGTTIKYGDQNKPSNMTNKAQMWKITKAGESLTDGYSHYLTADWTGTVEVETGVDVGENDDITSVTYERTTGDAQTAVIRTNSYDTSLVVNAPLDTIHHYGSLMSANLQKVSTSSYYEHGDTNLVEIASGRLVITNDTNAKVDNVYLTATDGENYKVEEVGIIIATQSGAKLPDVIRRDAVTETDGKVVCTIQTNVDVNGENPQKVDVVTIKGEDNVQEATNGYTNVADLTKMVLEAPNGSETEGASEFIGNEVAVATAEREGIKNEAKGTVIEVTFKETVSLHTISEFRDLWNAGEFFDLENPASIKLTGNVDMKKVGNWGPIGTWEYPFFGTFDGNNKKISNFSNHANADANGNYTHIYGVGDSIGYGETYGFFGIVGGGNTTIQSITFENVDINIENGKNVGAIVGYAPSNKKFKEDGATFANNKWNSNGSIGNNNLILNEVSVSGSVQGKNHIGGLVGKAYNGGSITLTSCVSDVVVSASASGGLSAFVGFISGPSSVAFDSCESTENSKLIALTSNVNYIGDLYGFCKISAVITDCTSYTKLELPENFAITATTSITMYSDCIVEDVTFTSNSKELGIYGNMTLKNCVIQTKNFRNYRNGNLTIEDSTVNVGFENYGTTTIKSGTFNIPVTNWLDGTMTIEDGSFTKSDGSGSVISNYGSLTITGYTSITNTKDASYNDKITNQEDTTTHTIGTLTIGNGEAITSGGPHLVSAVKKGE